MTWFRVTCKAECEMTVWVEAVDPTHARDLVRNGDYDEASDWEPRRGVRIPKAEELDEAPDFRRENP